MANELTESDITELRFMMNFHYISSEQQSWHLKSLIKRKVERGEPTDEDRKELEEVERRMKHQKEIIDKLENIGQEKRGNKQ